MRCVPGRVASLIVAFAASSLMARAAATQAQPTPRDIGNDSVAAGPRQDRPEIARLRSLVFDTQYDEAATEGSALLQRSDLNARDRTAVLEVVAIAQLASRARRQAAATLEELYRRDPGHLLSDSAASPTIQAAFSRAQEQPHEPIAVRIETRTAGELERDAPREVSVQLVEGADAVDELRLSIRRAGDALPTTIVMNVDATGLGRAPVLVDSLLHERVDLEYWCEALAPSQTRLATLGSSEQPLHVMLPERPDLRVSLPTGQSNEPSGPPRDTSDGVLTRWWFWTAVVGVLALGVTAYAVLGPPSQGPSNGTLGSANLQ